MVDNCETTPNTPDHVHVLIDKLLVLSHIMCSLSTAIPLILVVLLSSFLIACSLPCLALFLCCLLLHLLFFFWSLLLFFFCSHNRYIVIRRKYVLMPTKKGRFPTSFPLSIQPCLSFTSLVPAIFNNSYFLRHLPDHNRKVV